MPQRSLDCNAMRAADFALTAQTAYAMIAAAGWSRCGERGAGSDIRWSAAGDVFVG
jgi:hypothetical protein